jgi:hypothetical protein
MQHEIVLLPINSIIPYYNNAKKHPQEQIDKIVKSIQLTGFDQPIVINKDNVIIKGHGRLLASQQLGLEHVPCVVLDVPEEVANKARLIDNKSAESDYDINKLIAELERVNYDEILDTGFSQDELKSLLNQLEKESNISSVESVFPFYEDEEELQDEATNLQDSVKKAILIEFEKDDYPVGLKLVNESRKNNINIGKILIKALEEKQ